VTHRGPCQPPPCCDPNTFLFPLSLKAPSVSAAGYLPARAALPDDPLLPAASSCPSLPALGTGPAQPCSCQIAPIGAIPKKKKKTHPKSSRKSERQRCFAQGWTHVRASEPAAVWEQPRFASRWARSLKTTSKKSQSFQERNDGAVKTGGVWPSGCTAQRQLKLWCWQPNIASGNLQS